ncbi:MAG: hypothetical protein CL878_12150 [Dehalococcoidia bacterium]|nr:hypothetical protein [Dehalococcoidia bacterium]
MADRRSVRLGARRRRVWLGQALGIAGSALAAACTGASLQPAVPEHLSDAAASGQAEDGRVPLAGRILYVSSSNIHVWANGATTQLTADGASRQPSWSPDGHLIAHIKVQNSSSDIWVMEAAGAKLWRLTYYGQQPIERRRWAFRPRYWPTGNKLLFLSDEGTYDLMVWQLGLDGQRGSPLLRVPDGEGGLDHPSVSPDERRLLVTSYREERPQVWTWALPSGPWQQLTHAPGGAYDPAWSPDGTHIAYTQRQADKHDIWVMRVDGSGTTPLTTSGRARAPCWSPAGDAVAYIGDGGAGFDIWSAPVPPALVTADGASAVAAEPRQLTRGASVDAVSGLSWTG